MFATMEERKKQKQKEYVLMTECTWLRQKVAPKKTFIESNTCVRFSLLKKKIVIYKSNKISAKGK